MNNQEENIKGEKDFNKEVLDSKAENNSNDTKTKSESNENKESKTVEKSAEKFENLHEKLKIRRKRNIIVNSICLVLLVLGIFWIVKIFWHYNIYEITNDATVEQYITPINTKVQGYIKKINFTEHQKVKAGDTLVIIDDSEYRIILLDAEAALKDAEASQGVLESNIASSQSNIHISEANISETRVRMKNAEKDFKRYENLLKEESVSEQQYETMKTQYEALKAHYNSLILQKQSTKATSSGIEKKQGNIEASILRSQANLDLAKLNLSYTIITAPYDGHVGRRTIQERELVQAGQILTNIIKNNDKWITANYKEKQIANIYIGQEVNIKIDAFKGKIFKGKISAISEATGSKYSMIPIDNSAGNFVKIQQRIPVRIDFIDLSKEEVSNLRAGMMAETEALKK